MDSETHQLVQDTCMLTVGQVTCTLTLVRDTCLGTVGTGYMNDLCGCRSREWPLWLQKYE